MSTARVFQNDGTTLVEYLNTHYLNLNPSKHLEIWCHSDHWSPVHKVRITNLRFMLMSCCFCVLNILKAKLCQCSDSSLLSPLFCLESQAFKS